MSNGIRSLQRLGAAWENYDSPCLPLSQPSKSFCKIRLSFETPEVRLSSNPKDSKWQRSRRSSSVSLLFALFFEHDEGRTEKHRYCCTYAGVRVTVCCSVLIFMANCRLVNPFGLEPTVHMVGSQPHDSHKLHHGINKARAANESATFDTASPEDL